jgi:hypothetical protein
MTRAEFRRDNPCTTNMSNPTRTASPTKPRTATAILGTFYSYTAAGIGSVYSITSSLHGFSTNSRLASARALLRHQTSTDNDHLAVRRIGGLHPSYITLHGKGTPSKPESEEIRQLLDDSSRDIFDAVSFFLLISLFLFFLFFFRSQRRTALTAG